MITHTIDPEFLKANTTLQNLKKYHLIILKTIFEICQKLLTHIYKKNYKQYFICHKKRKQFEILVQIKNVVGRVKRGPEAPLE